MSRACACSWTTCLVCCPPPTADCSGIYFTCQPAEHPMIHNTAHNMSDRRDLGLCAGAYTWIYRIYWFIMSTVWQPSTGVYICALSWPATINSNPIRPVLGPRKAHSNTDMATTICSAQGPSHNCFWNLKRRSRRQIFCSPKKKYKRNNTRLMLPMFFMNGFFLGVRFFEQPTFPV